MSEDIEGSVLRSILEQLRTANQWLEVLASPEVRNALQQTLTRPIERRVYQNSDGRGANEIGLSVGVSHQTVRNYWKGWFAKPGIPIVRQGPSGRAVRIYDLPSLGIADDEPQDA